MERIYPIRKHQVGTKYKYIFTMKMNTFKNIPLQNLAFRILQGYVHLWSYIPIYIYTGIMRH
jgi:hypothetical protein